MNINELKNKCNDLYDNSIKLMENHKSITEVRDSLIHVSQNLNDLSKIDQVNKNKIEDKVLLIINCIKEIRETLSYDNVYKKLTGKNLKYEEKKKETIDSFVLNKDIEAEEETVKKETAINKNPLTNVKEACKAKQNNGIIKNNINQFRFNWNNKPEVSFDDVAGLEDVKTEVRRKVLNPLLHPEMYEGYDKRNGGGLLLFGPPGTGKTMIAAAIAKEIGAKFCSLGPSDILSTGVGNSEKAVARLFEEARSYDCAIIFFDEIESLCPVSTHAQHARQIRSELLRQIQGLDSYGKENNKILFIIAATNKPWDIDPAFVRPGRFGIRVYVGLPDSNARRYMIESKLNKIRNNGLVSVSDDIDIESIVEMTEGYNGSDIAYLLEEVQEISIDRLSQSNEKIIKYDDFINALNKVVSSVQPNDIKKIEEWKEINC